MENKKQWKDIEGYEGLYKISNHGDVKSVDRYVLSRRTSNVLFKKSKPIKKYISNYGNHLTVSLRKGSKQKVFFIKNLVASHFLEQIEGSIYVVCMDGNKFNCQSDNLKFTNYQGAIKNAYDNGNKKPFSIFNTERYKSGVLKILPISCKLNYNIIMEILHNYSDFKGNKTSDMPYVKIGRMYNVSGDVISNIIKRKTFKYIKSVPPKEYASNIN